MSIFKKNITIPLLLIGICLWGVMIYSNTLHAPFVFDDDLFITNNHAIRNIGDGVLWQNMGYRKRVVAFFSFALNYHFHGTQVDGYHRVNLAIHLLSALSVVWLVLLLFQTPRMRDERISEKRYAIALLCGWLFVSHPLQTETVTYLSQRFESLASLFYLFSVCCYIRGRELSGHFLKGGVFFLLSGIAMILGLLTKEIVLTLPLTLLLVEGLFFRAQTGNPPVKKDPPKAKSLWVFSGVVFFFSGLTLLYLWYHLPEFLLWPDELALTSDKYLLTQFRVIIKYLGLLFFPLRQNLDYDFPISSSLWEAGTFSSAACILCILLMAWRSIRRYPLISFGIFWFFLTLSVTSSIAPIRDIIFEHRLYLPSVGFFLVFCVALFYFIKNVRTLILCLSGIILIFSFLTYQRNAVWADDLKLWEDTVSKSPDKARPHANLGQVYRLRKEYRNAVTSYLKALSLNIADREDKAQIYVNLSAVYGELEDYDKEIFYCLKALELDPNLPQAYSNLGYAYALTHQYEKALKYGKKAVEMAPKFEEGLNNLGVIYGRMGQYKNAAEFFERVLKLDPHDEKARKNLRLAREIMNQ